MANQSTSGFGLKPIRKVAQTNDTGGLGEWAKAASSAAINHHELTQLQADGTVLSSTVSTANNIGSLNGSFYTDPSTSKPTWSNYAPLTTATDQVCLINDDTRQMYEMRTQLTSLTTADVGGCSPIVVGTGSGAPNFISGNLIGAVGATDNQIKIFGLTRDDNNQDVSVSGSVWRVMICHHILGNNFKGI